MKRITQIVAFCLLTVTHLAAQKNYVSEVWVSDLGNGKYKNPVLYADYSDPDACRVGEDFYMTSSSFNCLPGLQILHSKDLVNWTIVGAAVPDALPPIRASLAQVVLQILAYAGVVERVGKKGNAYLYKVLEGDE